MDFLWTCSVPILNHYHISFVLEIWPISAHLFCTLITPLSHFRKIYQGCGGRSAAEVCTSITLTNIQIHVPEIPPIGAECRGMPLGHHHYIVWSTIKVLQCGEIMPVEKIKLASHFSGTECVWVPRSTRSFHYPAFGTIHIKLCTSVLNRSSCILAFLPNATQLCRVEGCCTLLLNTPLTAYLFLNAWSFKFCQIIWRYRSGGAYWPQKFKCEICLYLWKVKLKRKGEPRPTSGGFYSHTSHLKSRKNLFIFVAHRHPGPLSPNHLAKFKWPHVFAHGLAMIVAY